MDSDGSNMHLLTCVDGVLERREVCQALDKAPHDPAAGASSVAMFNVELRANPLFLDDIIADRAMAVFSKYSLLIRVCSKNPQEAWGAFCDSRIGVFGLPQCVQIAPSIPGGRDRNASWNKISKTASPLVVTVKCL